MKKICFLSTLCLAFIFSGCSIGDAKSASTNSSQQPTGASSDMIHSESSAQLDTSETRTESTTDLQEDNARKMMSSLQGTWGVMNSGNIITIHADGTWSTHQLGTTEDRIIPVTIYSYDAEQNILYINADGRDSELHILSDTEFMVTNPDNDTSSIFNLMD